MSLQNPLISIIIPAYNEEAEIGACLRSIKTGFEQAGLVPFEIIVSDDASTDRTVEAARAEGAQVVHSGLRNIGATRNVGARSGVGEYLLFVDADTQVPVETARALRRILAEGVLGGGATIRWNSPVPWHARLPVLIWNRISRISQLPAGSFLFVKRTVFEEIGGFDQHFLAGEEIVLGRALKRKGRLVILREPVLTSPRKLQLFTPREMLGFLLCWAWAPRRTLRDRRNLDYWYARRD